MPAAGIAAKMSFQVTPVGLKPPPALKLLGWKWNSRTMMVRTGMATFHQVMPLLTCWNSRIARKLMAVKTAIRTIVKMKPVVVIFPVVVLKRLCQ